MHNPQWSCDRKVYYIITNVMKKKNDLLMLEANWGKYSLRN